jgi:hypothetical protein
MNKLVTTCFVLLFFSSVFGQTIDGIVMDLNQNPIAQAEVYDTISKTKTITDESGFFELEVGDSFALEISHPLYLKETFDVARSDLKSSAVYVMKERIQFVEGVTVSSERMQTVVDQKNFNVIDYLPFDESILVLKSHKGKRMLSIEGQDTTYQTFSLGDLKPHKIFLDCFENIHLLTRDSSYQIWMDTVVHVVYRASIDQFNYSIKPCVADFGDTRVFGNFSHHNKRYTLTSIHNETKTKEHFLHIRDEEGERVARSCYYEIIGRYHAVTPWYENIITDGAWSGNVMELQSLDNHLDRMVNWYLNIRATELNIQSFRYNNVLVNVDQYSDSIRVYNAKNKLLRAKHYDFHNSERIQHVLLDRSNGTLYEQFMEKGVYTIREIPINEKAKRKDFKLTEVPFCTNIRIHDDWVYFMVEENNFYQINRILLEKK